jgi:hypothetical protein
MSSSEYTSLAISFLERACWYWQQIAEESTAASDVLGTNKALAHLKECQVSIDLLRRKDRSGGEDIDPARFAGSA